MLGLHHPRLTWGRGPSTSPSGGPGLSGGPLMRRAAAEEDTSGSSVVRAEALGPCPSSGQMPAIFFSRSLGQRDWELEPLDAGRVHPDVPVFVGTATAAQDLPGLRKHNITYVLSTSARDADPAEAGAAAAAAAAALSPGPDGLVFASVHLSDHASSDLLGALPEAVEFIRAALAAKSGVLVNGISGVSRASAVCAGFLIMDRGMTLEQAMSSIRATRPSAKPNSGFMTQLELLAACKGDVDQARSKFLGGLIGVDGARNLQQVMAEMQSRAKAIVTTLDELEVSVNQLQGGSTNSSAGSSPSPMALANGTKLQSRLIALQRDVARERKRTHVLTDKSVDITLRGAGDKITRLLNILSRACGEPVGKVRSASAASSVASSPRSVASVKGSLLPRPGTTASLELDNE